MRKPIAFEDANVIPKFANGYWNCPVCREVFNCVELAIRCRDSHFKAVSEGAPLCRFGPGGVYIKDYPEKRG